MSRPVQRPRPGRTSGAPTGLIALGLLGLALLAGLIWLSLTPVTADRGESPASTAASPRSSAPESAPLADSEAETPAAPATRSPAKAPAANAARALVGTVTSSASDAPLQGVVVRLVVVPPGADGPREHAARTDAAGRYRLDEAAGRAVRLAFEAPGFEPRVFEQPALGPPPVATWDAELVPGSGIQGIVLSPEGPAPGTILGLWLGENGRVSTVAQADDEGRFSLDLPDAPGPYILKARHTAHGEARMPVSGPGEIVVHLPGGGYLSGHVVDTARDPIQTFAVSAEPRQRRMMAAPVAQSFDTGDGAFRLGPVAAGKYTLRAAAVGFQPGEPVEVEVGGGEETSDITLVMKASGRLEGRVTDARTRAPVEGALVVPAEWSNGDLAESVGAMTGADGTYRLEALPGKRSSLNVSAEGYRTLLGGGVTVPPGKIVRRDFALTPQARGQGGMSELTGIGAVLAPRADGVAISQLVEGGPAARALNAGDVLVSVDGQSTVGKSLSDVANAIRGEQGTEVVLLVKRGGEGPPERVVLRRDRVAMPETGHGGRTPHGDPHGGRD